MIIVLGITGDLARRKLLPALYNLEAAGQLPDSTIIVGSSRRQVSNQEIFDRVELPDSQTAVSARFKARLRMVQFDPADETAHPELKRQLTAFGTDLAPIFYLSIPPAGLADVISKLGRSGLAGPEAKLLLEKPFGRDLVSAETLAAALQSAFSDEQIYCIDHYLAKEAVQNITVFRRKNPLFDNLLSNRYVASIYIRADEKLDIQGRSVFYEQTGALRDLIQSHLLQLLAETAMTLQPEAADGRAIAAAKLAFLESLQAPAASAAVRGQYAGYRDEVDIPASKVETFAAIKLTSQDARWQGVPFILETGKALGLKRTDITITFKSTDLTQKATQLVFDIDPDPAISLTAVVRQVGFTSRTAEQALRLNLEAANDQPEAGAYEHLFYDLLRSDKRLFVTPAQALASWRLLEPVLDNWQNSADSLQIYPKNSDGPSLAMLN